MEFMKRLKYMFRDLYYIKEYEYVNGYFRLCFDDLTVIEYKEAKKLYKFLVNERKELLRQEPLKQVFKQSNKYGVITIYC